MIPIHRLMPCAATGGLLARLAGCAGDPFAKLDLNRDGSQGKFQRPCQL